MACLSPCMYHTYEPSQHSKGRSLLDTSVVDNRKDTPQSGAHVFSSQAIELSSTPLEARCDCTVPDWPPREQSCYENFSFAHMFFSSISTV